MKFKKKFLKRLEKERAMATTIKEGLIRLRSELSKESSAALETKWLVEPTALSFADWLYIHHNVFAYNVDEDTIAQLKLYRALLGISDPKAKGYVHFVEWLMSVGRSFRDDVSGRTSEDIIKLYHAETENQRKEVTEEPSDDVDSEKIIIRTKAMMQMGEWDRLVQQFSSEGGEYGLYDWLMVHHKVADVQTGSFHVEEYNNSTFSDPNSENFLVFPRWLVSIKKVERQTIAEHRLGFRDLAIVCEKEWGIDTQAKEQVIPFPKKKGTMTLDEVNQCIAHIEDELKELGSAVTEKKLAIALRYRNSILERQTQGEQLCLPLS